MTEEELANFRDLGQFLRPNYNQWNLPDPFWGTEQEWVTFEERLRLDHFIRTWDGSPIAGSVDPARREEVSRYLGGPDWKGMTPEQRERARLLIDAYAAKYTEPPPCEYGPNLLK